MNERLHFVPLALLSGSDKIAFDLGHAPRPHALHVLFVLGQPRDSFVLGQQEILIGWDRVRRRLRLMGNGLLTLRGNNFRLCWVLFLEEVQRIDCLYLVMVSLGLSNNPRAVVAGVDLRQVL